MEYSGFVFLELVAGSGEPNLIILYSWIFYLFSSHQHKIERRNLNEKTFKLSSKAKMNI